MFHLLPTPLSPDPSDSVAPAAIDMAREAPSDMPMMAICWSSMDTWHPR